MPTSFGTEHVPHDLIILILSKCSFT